MTYLQLVLAAAAAATAAGCAAGVVREFARAAMLMRDFLTRRTSPAAVRWCRGFLHMGVRQQCRSNSLPGYNPVALSPSGVATRCIHVCLHVFEPWLRAIARAA